MIPEGPLYGFCIGNGYTREKSPKIRSKKMQKLEENVEFELNGSFRGAGELKLGPNGSKKHFVFKNPVRLSPNRCFWPVLRHPDFSKNPDFFWGG